MQLSLRNSSQGGMLIMQPLNVKTPPLRAVASGEMAMQGGLNRVQVAAHGAMVLAPAVYYFFIVRRR